MMTWAVKIEEAKRRGEVLLYPFGELPKRTIPGLAGVTLKFAENVAKAHFELARDKWDPKAISALDREVMNSIIAHTINYTGQLSKVILEDYIKFEREIRDAGRVFLMESEIRWTSADTPYPYMKYRNAQGDIYEKAGQIARENIFGFWNEITFTKLWQANLRIPRHNPRDCKTRK